VLDEHLKLSEFEIRNMSLPTDNRSFKGARTMDAARSTMDRSS